MGLLDKLFRRNQTTGKMNGAGIRRRFAPMCSSFSSLRDSLD